MALIPTQKSKRKTNDPKNLIMFGLPKSGKTTSLAELPDNLIIDLENGSDYIEGYIAKANSVQDLYKLAVALTPTKSDGTPNPAYEGHHFKFITIDTVTALEELALPLAKKLYMETPMGKNFDGDSVLKLPNGAGHLYLREAVQQIIGWFEKVADNVILVGHVKDKSLTEGGTELNVKTLDLGGKLSNILAAKSDAICYVYRDTTTGDLMANFGDMNSVLTGARMQHLAGKTIQLAERKLNDANEWEIVTHWDRIYPSLKESNE